MAPRDDARDARDLLLFEQLPDPGARDELFARFRTMSDFLARQYGGRGEALDDLQQVAGIGLLKAIDGFDTTRGVRFTTYATATIVGELKRHFRDKGWAMHVPRRLQEIGLEVNRASSDLSQELGRSPSVLEIATRTDLDPDDVLDGLDALRAYSTSALEVAPDDRSDAPIDLLGAVDPAMGLVDEFVSLAPGIEDLDPRERRILYLRFFNDMTQSEIAEAVGVSQMHVSRLLAQALDTLRERSMPAAPEDSS